MGHQPQWDGVAQGKSMAAVLVFIVAGIVALAIVCIAIKIVVALLPAALVIGAIGILCLTFCDDTCAAQDEPMQSHIEKIEEIEKKVKQIRDNSQQKYHQQIRSMTRQKPSVNLEDILPEIDSAISVVVWAYCVATGDENFKPLITSANDYEGHMEQSAHYSGAAVDFRIKDMGDLAERKELVNLIREELGERFTVLHEDIGKSNEHLHVQLRRGAYERNVVWK